MFLGNNLQDQLHSDPKVDEYLNGGNYQSTLNILNHFASNTGVGNFLKNITWKKIFKNSITRKILQFLLAVF